MHLCSLLFPTGKFEPYSLYLFKWIILEKVLFWLLSLIHRISNIDAWLGPKCLYLKTWEWVSTIKYLSPEIAMSTLDVWQRDGTFIVANRRWDRQAAVIVSVISFSNRQCESVILGCDSLSGQAVNQRPFNRPEQAFLTGLSCSITQQRDGRKTHPAASTSW